jgi:cysteine desulfurase
LSYNDRIMPPIYLDYNATTPVDPAVTEAMLPYLRDQFGNPSSTHALGRAAHEAVDKARAQVASLLGAQPDEIVFTGGGSEASNHAIKGAVFGQVSGLFRRRARGAHIITSAVEHPATLQPCAFLERLGCKVTILPVDRYGLVDPDDVAKALTPATMLVSIMHANNEVGTIEPIREIAELARRHGALMHTDAAQSCGKIPVRVNELGVDLLSLAGHKLYAPKGIGALYVRRGVKLEPLIHGAGHEAGRRAGTENVPYIVALGKACELAERSLPQAGEKLQKLRDRLWCELKDALGDKVVLNGHPELRLPNTLNVNFVGHIGAELLQKVPAIAASTGSACHEGNVTLSPVLKAMGVSPELGRGAVRLSVGRFSTEDEVRQTTEALIAVLRRSSQEQPSQMATIEDLRRQLVQDFPALAIGAVREAPSNGLCFDIIVGDREEDLIYVCCSGDWGYSVSWEAQMYGCCDIPDLESTYRKIREFISHKDD